MKTSLCVIAFMLIGFCLFAVDQQSPPKVKAAVSETMERGFIADEKSLRKLNEVLKQRFSEKASLYAITYTVKFGNGFYYDTTAIETLLAEENVVPRQVLSLEIAARVVPDVQYSGPLTVEQRKQLEESLLKLQTGETPEINVRLAEDGVSYSLRGADRDWVLNTQVDLADRLKGLLTPSRIVPYSIAGIVAPLAMTLTFAGFARRFRNRFDANRRASDPNVRTTRLRDYIFRINDPALSLVTPMITFQFAMLVGALACLGTYYSIALLYPERVFLIGGEVERYATLINIRQYLLTGVAISFVVGVIASIIANLATRSKP